MDISHSTDLLTPSASSPPGAPHPAFRSARTAMPPSRLQRVVRVLDGEQLQPLADIAARTGLRELVVKVALYQLHERGIVAEGDDGWVLTDFGHELLTARTAAPDDGLGVGEGVGVGAGGG